MLKSLSLLAKATLLSVAFVVLSLASLAIIEYQITQNKVIETATARQDDSLRVAASVLQSEMGGVEIAWSGREIRRIQIDSIPESFDSHAMVDSIGRITGETVTLFAWEPQSQDFWRRTTNIIKDDGQRAVGTNLGKTGAVYPVVARGETFRGEAVILGKPYYTIYQPTFGPDGKVNGILYAGVLKSRIDGVLGTLVQRLGVTSLIVLVIACAALTLGLRRLLHPLQTLTLRARQVGEIPDQVTVPYTDKVDEIGKLANAIESFRQATLQKADLEQQRAEADAHAAAQRDAMLRTLSQSFGSVVEAAAQGDFSRTVDGTFDDPALSGLKDGINQVIRIVDTGTKAVADAIRGLADSDLTARVQGQHMGVFATLQADVNQMADSLQAVLADLRETALTVDAAAIEIDSGANDLGVRTTQQASSLEQTAAAVENILGLVKANTQRSAEARTMVTEASSVAARGGQVMGEAQAAMTDITERATRISEIIGLIDGIAFQTNLLALNASVEAARAGDAGKGFTVVAAEVRRLAQSAAEASQEVKSLIEASADAVTSGSERVEMAAEVLTTLVNAVSTVGEGISAVAEASDRQTEALTEISAAVRTLDDMTQQNAALVDENTAAIGSVRTQTSRLNQTVSRFRVA